MLLPDHIINCSRCVECATRVLHRLSILELQLHDWHSGLQFCADFLQIRLISPQAISGVVEFGQVGSRAVPRIIRLVCVPCNLSRPQSFYSVYVIIFLIEEAL